MFYEKEVAEPWFSHIATGRKSIEGRIYKNDFRKMQVGDTIRWFNEDRSCQAIITKLRYYENFESYLLFEGISNCLPGISNLTEALNVYLKPTGFFTKEEESTSMVVAIHFDLI